MALGWGLWEAPARFFFAQMNCLDSIEIARTSGTGEAERVGELIQY